MFESIGKYFYDRRRGFAKAAGFFGGAYLIGRYVLDRLEEIRERVMQERAARENVRKRFQQNMEDISFTIMTQLPILGQNILTDMNVEALTSELQSITRASRANTQPPPPPVSEAPALPSPAPDELSSSTYPPDPYGQGSVTSASVPPQAHSQAPSSPSLPTSDSSLASSMEFIVPAAPPYGISTRPLGAPSTSTNGKEKDADSFSLLSPSVSAPMDGSSSVMSTSQLGTSWVDEFSERQSQGLASHPETRRASEDEGASSSQHSASRPEDGRTTGNSQTGSLLKPIASGLSSEVQSVSGSSQLDLSTSQLPTSDATRSKAELWREVKMLTMTRTLTVLYSTTLLSLFTHIQLSLLGRYKYVRAILELEADERAREQLDYETDVSSLFFSGAEQKRAMRDEEDARQTSASGMSHADSFSTWARFGRIEVEHADADDDGYSGFPSSRARRRGRAVDHHWIEEPISDETERMYLMLSWWILNVGWKDVGERVRRGVEEVFEEVSLKSKVGMMDLNRLLGDVRRRVECEVTFEGKERRINFLSTLLPPTSSALSHLLGRTGFSSPSSNAAHGVPSHPEQNPIFNALLSETRDLLSSSDFLFVLERCLDRGTEVLLDGIHKNVFSGEAGSGLMAEDEPKLRLAGMLPGLARWSALALTSVPNELVDNLADIREVEGLAAIIYSSYEDRFR